MYAIDTFLHENEFFSFPMCRILLSYCTWVAKVDDSLHATCELYFGHPYYDMSQHVFIGARNTAIDIHEKYLRFPADAWLWFIMLYHISFLVWTVFQGECSRSIGCFQFQRSIEGVWGCTQALPLHQNTWWWTSVHQISEVRSHFLIPIICTF